MNSNTKLFLGMIILLSVFIFVFSYSGFCFWNAVLNTGSDYSYGVLVVIHPVIIATTLIGVSMLWFRETPKKRKKKK